jgi:hypothetical protein
MVRFCHFWKSFSPSRNVYNRYANTRYDLATTAVDRTLSLSLRAPSPFVTLAVDALFANQCHERRLFRNEFVRSNVATTLPYHQTSDGDMNLLRARRYAKVSRIHCSLNFKKNNLRDGSLVRVRHRIIFSRGRSVERGAEHRTHESNSGSSMSDVSSGSFTSDTTEEDMAQEEFENLCTLLRQNDSSITRVDSPDGIGNYDRKLGQALLYNTHVTYLFVDLDDITRDDDDMVEGGRMHPLVQYLQTSLSLKEVCFSSDCRCHRRSSQP